MDTNDVLVRYLPPKSRPIAVISAGILLQLTFGQVYTFGNIMPYLASYLHERVDKQHPTDAASMIWLQTLMGGIPFAMLLGGYLERKVGPRFGAFIGCILFTTGTIASYWTIQSSYFLLLLTYGLMTGLGQGIAYNNVLICAQKWIPNRVGLASGLIVGGFGCGAFIFSPIQTKFVNPLNYSPNVDGVFTQSDLLDRVPKLFLLLGAIYALFQIIGLFLIADPSESPIDDDADDERTPLFLPIDTQSSIPVDLRDALCSSTFVVLFFTLFFCAMWSQMISALYKAFGQTFISDDFFLAAICSAASVCNSLSRVVWGVVADRTSYQLTMSIVTSVGTALMLTLPMMPLFNRYVYFVWVLAMFCCNGAIYTLLPYATNKCFGRKNFGLIYGFEQLALTTAGTAGALITQLILPSLGYAYLYLIIGSISYISFILTINIHRTRFGTQPCDD